MLQKRRQRSILDKWYSSEERVLPFFNYETEQHLDYVQGYTRIIATQYAKLFPKSRMTKEKIERIVKAARLHDVGKLAIPEWILLKDGRMSEGELDILKTHTVKGCEMVHLLGQTDDEEYNRICHNIVLYHHEKYDGSGYPYGLKKDKIPTEAQIVALADIYDVLIHGEGERKRFTKDEAFQMIMRNDFGQISPKLKECFAMAKEAMETLQIEE